MPQFTLNDLANNAGQTAANAGINLANEAKSLACGLYKNYTGWATKLDLPTPPPAAFVKGVWDTVCSNDPGGLPAPPSNPGFDGGQCSCQAYTCRIYVTYENGATGYFTQGAVGSIKGLRKILASGSQLTKIELGDSICVNGVPTGETRWTLVTNTGNPDFNAYGFVSIQLTNGQPDACGNPPSGSYPYVVPPPAALNKNVTVNYNDGTDFTVPLAFAQMNNNLDITVDVGGVGFNFNVGGVSFNWNQNSDNDYINDFSPGGGGSGGGGVGGGGAGGDNNFVFNNKLDNITNKIDNTLDVKLDDVIIDVDLIKDTLDSAQDCCPEPPDLDTQTAIVCPIDDGNTYTGIVDLVSVKLDVTKLPLSSKIQFGNGSPNVLFAGWLAFTHDGQAYEREPIHFEYNLFVPPKGANGFFYCLTNGAKGRVIYYVKT